MSYEENENIDEIVQKLKATNPEQNELSVPNVDDESVNRYVFEKSTELVESSLQAIQTIRDTIIQGVSPDEINALSSLINATNKALDTLNKINLQNKRDKTSERLKNLELAARKEMFAKRIPNTTNVLIATREEIMKQIYSNGNNALPSRTDTP
jgi:DNA-binding transcriptional MerR regulator